MKSLSRKAGPSFAMRMQVRLFCVKCFDTCWNTKFVLPNGTMVVDGAPQW